MSAASGAPGWSPSVGEALQWASGCAALRGGERTVTSSELFVGLLLAHPDPKGEVWQFLDYFGLTARDLLPDDYRVIDGTVLHEAAVAARAPDPADWDTEVSSILDSTRSRAGGTPQVLHVLAELLSPDSWQERLQTGLTRFGISASDVVREFNVAVPSLDSAGSDSSEGAAEKINLGSSTAAAHRSPKTQVRTVGVCSNDHNGKGRPSIIDRLVPGTAD